MYFKKERKCCQEDLFLSSSQSSEVCCNCSRNKLEWNEQTYIFPVLHLKYVALKSAFQKITVHLLLFLNSSRLIPAGAFVSDVNSNCRSMQIFDYKKDKRIFECQCVEPGDLKEYFSIWMLFHIHRIGRVFHLNVERAYDSSNTVDWVPNSHISNNCSESMNAGPCASEGIIYFWACFLDENRSLTDIWNHWNNAAWFA